MDSSQARAVRLVACILLFAAAKVACNTSRQAVVESLQGPHPLPLPLSFASLEGRRDGDRVNAILEFQNPANRERLIIQMGIDLGPPIRLAGGTFRLMGTGSTQMGKVHSQSLDFQAGQSGGMGLGGRFILLDDTGRELYRVDLPSTVIGVSYQ